jgi:hypothetical protein
MLKDIMKDLLEFDTKYKPILSLLMSEYDYYAEDKHRGSNHYRLGSDFILTSFDYSLC